MICYLDLFLMQSASLLESVCPLNKPVVFLHRLCWYYKIGSRVHIHCAVQNITADSNLQMISMPSGYIPYNVIVAGGRGSAATSPATIWINSSGVVSVRSTTAYAAGDLEYDAFS